MLSVFSGAGILLTAVAVIFGFSSGCGVQVAGLVTPKVATLSYSNSSLTVTGSGLRDVYQGVLVDSSTGVPSTLFRAGGGDDQITLKPTSTIRLVSNRIYTFFVNNAQAASFTVPFTVDLSQVGPTGNTSLGFIANSIQWMTLTPDGKFGIGTNTPAGLFEVVDAESDGHLFSTEYSNTPARGGTFYGRRARGTVASPSAVLVDDTLTALFGLGYNSSAYSNPAGAVRILAGETFTSARNGSYITFETTPIGSRASASRTERMRVTDAGSVGIGTTSPSGLLEVADNDTGANITNSEYSTATAGRGASFTGRRGRGTSSSPSAIQANDVMTGLYGQGYASTPGFSTSSASIRFFASEAYTSAANGSYITLETTANGSTTRNERLRVDQNGNVGVGNPSPLVRLDVSGVAAVRGGITPDYTTAGLVLTSGFAGTGDSDFMNLKASGTGGFKFYDGTIGAAPTLIATLNTSGAVVAASDKRLKTQILPIENGLEKLLKLGGYTYFWKDPNRPKERQVGVIAQEVESVFPELVQTDERGNKMVNYAGLVAPLIEAVKSIKAKLDILQTENKQLKEEVTGMKTYLCAKDPHADFCRK